MMRLKGCPKCKGDMALERDVFGWYEQCLQCGYIREIAEIDKAATRTKEREKEPVPVG